MSSILSALLLHHITKTASFFYCRRAFWIYYAQRRYIQSKLNSCNTFCGHENNCSSHAGIMEQKKTRFPRLKKTNLTAELYLKRHVFPKGDVSGHRQMVELQHVGNALEADQVFLNLSADTEKSKSSVCELFNPTDPLAN